MLMEINPLQAFLVGALIVALIAALVVLRQRKRFDDTETERQRLEAVAVKAREMLSAAPDGLFLWDHVNGGFTCSRRLAGLLNLDAGTQAHYEDIRACFDGDSLRAPAQSVSLLRPGGTPLALSLAPGTRRPPALRPCLKGVC